MATTEVGRGSTALVAVNTTEVLAKRLENMYGTIQKDRPHYDLFKQYVEGDHAKPHVPATARVEVREIVNRSVLNLIPLLVGIPAQISFIDGLRRGKDMFPPEWDAWKRSGMTAKQTTIFRTSLIYGAAYVALDDLSGGKPRMNLLSTRDTVAYYHDPVNDRFPVFALTMKSYPLDEHTPGRAIYYDANQIIQYDYTIEGEFTNSKVLPHKLGRCPVVRFACTMDDGGELRGVVEPMIPVQDRVNQTSFDLLVTQTFSSFKVRWASGMQGEPVIDPETGEQKLDADGEPMVKPIPVSQSTWITTDDPAAKMGTLDETPLDGFISAFEMAVKHFAVTGQLPPHALLGSMSNLSAETLVAAMSQTMRFGHVLKTSWGLAQSDLFWLAAIAMDNAAADDDSYEAEVRWRDMSDQTLSTVVDALGKAAQMLEMPKRALWQRVPGMTTGDIEVMEGMADELALNAQFDAPSPQAAVEREAPTPLELFGTGARGQE